MAGVEAGTPAAEQRTPAVEAQWAEYAQGVDAALAPVTSRVLEPVLDDLDARGIYQPWLLDVGGAGASSLGDFCYRRGVLYSASLGQESPLSVAVQAPRPDAARLPFGDQGFDVVHNRAILARTPAQPEGLFSELLRVTKDCGKLVIADFDWGALGPEEGSDVYMSVRAIRALFMATLLMKGSRPDFGGDVSGKLIDTVAAKTGIRCQRTETRFQAQVDDHSRHLLAASRLLLGYLRATNQTEHSEVLGLSMQDVSRASKAGRFRMRMPDLVVQTVTVEGRE